MPVFHLPLQPVASSKKTLPITPYGGNKMEGPVSRTVDQAPQLMITIFTLPSIERHGSARRARSAKPRRNCTSAEQPSEARGAP